MRVVELKNDGSKLSRQLLRLVDFTKGNNYQDTNLRVVILCNKIIVSTFCTNESGREWCNQNHTEVEKENIPFFAAKKLGII